MLGSDPEFEKEKLVRPDLVFKDWVWIQTEHPVRKESCFIRIFDTKSLILIF